MKDYLQTFFTAISASLATLYFVSLANPEFTYSKSPNTQIEELVVPNKAVNTVSGNPFRGEIILFAGNFAPSGWAFCQGQLIPISSNTALFALLGTTYGGDGETTFALPDLRGRVPVHPGTGSGLTARNLGQNFGSESVATPTYTSTNVAAPGRTDNVSVLTGQSVNSDNMQPSLGVHYIIALVGTFPSE